jgi:acetyltransferase-like isoleucine patch superfamily enzyme
MKWIAFIKSSLQLPIRFIRRIKEKIYVWFAFWGHDVELGKLSRFKGRPIIQMASGTKLIIGKGVFINSSNSGYHLNMHSPCKLLLDRHGASIIIGDNSRIHGACIHAYGKITIGKNCLIAANSHIMDGNGHDLCAENPQNRIHTSGTSQDIVIGDNVWISANCIVLPGSEIGEGAVIGAGSVVRGKVPARHLAAGNPLQIIKPL